MTLKYNGIWGKKTIIVVSMWIESEMITLSESGVQKKTAHYTSNVPLKIRELMGKWNV